ncbi:putative two-component system response regulator [Aneurinibacillus soli]|uniref:Cyclic di-GMP phosphodiesterase response regulator RpfG n=1 Tax=Aneurinibacillus soli TaxID=1500254 RepID=A0A0U5BEC2_9BACL|nr:HD domain-containing phosphohydrolase [Aneurinibacillus soli]PYE59691.1 putative two-component system response regulator [Aneurinibacillus soli]BAU29308.1 Cyclic di-GMP phosphodiesterase response regulator RpfG [Aneurinibacillus soli]
MRAPALYREASILIVSANEEKWKQLLGGYGYECTTTIHNTDMLAELPSDFCPDLLLLDIGKRWTEHTVWLSCIYSYYPNEYIPVIMAGEEKDERYCLQALDEGVRDLIHMPIRERDAMLRIRNALEIRWLNRAVQAQKRELEIRTHKMYKSQYELVRLLGNAAEYRDNDTGLHVTRMSRYTSCLGAAAGLPAIECELLLQASSLHDIGKIGIPDSILLKKGMLTEEEWKIMQTHTIIGARILGGSSYRLLQLAEIIALTHHEKWDGSGYPNQLKEDEIPLVGQLTAISDVFDALTSDRPYKKAWTVQEARAEIIQGSGTHFNPDLVTLFVDTFDELVSIKEQYNECLVTKLASV